MLTLQNKAKSIILNSAVKYDLLVVGAGLYGAVTAYRAHKAGKRVLVIDDAENPLSLADDRIEKAIRENNAKLMIIDPLQAFLGANVDMNRANEVRPVFRNRRSAWYSPGIF